MGDQLRPRPLQGQPLTRQSPVRPVGPPIGLSPVGAATCSAASTQSKRPYGRSTKASKDSGGREGATCYVCMVH
ncbi:hypothetical protein B296_00019572 [Ensete ventricosum]|uniref:Uncharacterized protein n=1 Tax=Ensete ventricosum TaxID=4639 RepID=A0A427AT09_ENSVE|nr:hypothetical protein B296_00019572 [Ensete ventricosum]